jgi:predicted permease
MHWLKSLWQTWFGRPRAERELDDELRFHLDALIAENVRRGMPPEEARRQAQLELGRVEQVKEQVREGRAGFFLETLWQDLRYGARMLRRNPGFTLVAVLTLALGIGANAAIFNYVNALFLMPLDLPEPERLVRIYGTADDSRLLSYANLADLRERNETLAGLAPHVYVPVSFRTTGEAEGAHGELVGGSYFSVLGVRPAIGRTLLPSDDVNVGGHPVVVISDGLWKRRLGSSTDVVGRSIFLNGAAFTIVGVAPANFRGTYDSIAVDFWAPIMMYEQIRPRSIPLTNRNWGWLAATARLKPGMTVEQARADADRIAAQIQREFPGGRPLRFEFFPASALPGQYQQGASRFLLFFAVVVGLVLLAACANISGLFLARMESRRHEMAVRLSMGATPLRLFRQGLTESLLLSLLAGIAALVVAQWASQALLNLRPPVSEWQRFSPQLGLHGPVLGWTILLSVVAGVLCGVFPALRARRAQLVTVLKEEVTRTARRRHRLRGFLVAAQVAVSTVILIASGLLLRSLLEVRAFHPGFEAPGLLLANFDLRRNRYDAARSKNFYEQLVERLRSVPGVEHATVATIVPLGDGADNFGFRIEGYQSPDGQRVTPLDYMAVGSDYFATMKIPVLQGRAFEPADFAPNARPVVIVNETMARKFWPAGSAVGRTLGADVSGPNMEIVGVVADINYYSLAEEPFPFVFLPITLLPNPSLIVHMRVSGNAAPVGPLVRNEVQALDPNVTVQNLGTFEEMRRVALFPQQMMAGASGVFGVLVLLLSSVGLYGLVAYAVVERTREIGIRMALGAQAGTIVGLMLRDAVVGTLFGVAAGMAIALGVTRQLSSILFGVRSSDPLTYAAVGVLLLGIALLACWIPARRATRVDPMVALRHE